MTRLPHSLLAALLAALLVALPLRAQQAERTYVHAEHGWSVVQPAGWVLDTLDGASSASGRRPTFPMVSSASIAARCPFSR